MKLGRRTFVMSALAGAAGAPAVAAAGSQPRLSDRSGLLIFDSRRACPEALTAWNARFERRLDLAALDRQGWMALRNLDRDAVGMVSGCTGWQDFVVLRDLLRERRLHLVAPEARLPAAGGRALFLWHMA